MNPINTRELAQSVRALQARVRLLEAACLVLVLAALGLAGLRWLPVAVAEPPKAAGDKVLRARGLIIEDERGRERILLGAPAPVVEGRKRKDPATALIFVGKNGADRAIFGLTPGPQVKGKVIPRIAAAAGMSVHDADGNERGGFGYLDNKRVVLGIDFKDHEGIGLMVDDADGSASVMLNNEAGGIERAGLYAGRDGTTVVKVDGSPVGGGLVMKAGNTGAAELLSVEAKTHKMTDVLTKVK